MDDTGGTTDMPRARGVLHGPHRVLPPLTVPRQKFDVGRVWQRLARTARRTPNTSQDRIFGRIHRLGALLGACAPEGTPCACATTCTYVTVEGRVRHARRPILR